MCSSYTPISMYEHVLSSCLFAPSLGDSLKPSTVRLPPNTDQWLSTATTAWAKAAGRLYPIPPSIEPRSRKVFYDARAKMHAPMLLRGTSRDGSHGVFIGLSPSLAPTGCTAIEQRWCHM